MDYNKSKFHSKTAIFLFKRYFNFLEKVLGDKNMVNNWKYFHLNLYDNTYCTYMAGSFIYGKIDFFLNERVKINFIKVRLVGEGKVHWTEMKGNGRLESTQTFNGNEIYIDVVVQVLAKRNGEDMYLEKGKYCFPFEIRLPDNLPTSIEDANGRIRYVLSATASIPWSLNKTFKFPITIISRLDLNKNIELSLSQSIKNSKTICCLWCIQRPINVRFNLHKIGFVPGEEIHFSCYIDNQSSRKITIVTLKLVQVLKFHATSKSKTVTRDVTHIVYNKEILPSQKVNWENSILTIPSVCPSSQNTSHLIEVTYTLVLCVEPKWPSTALVIKTPVTIGSIPFRQDVLENYNIISSNSFMSDLPTYEECVFSSKRTEENCDEQNEEVNFLPLYPFYSQMHR